MPATQVETSSEDCLVIEFSDAAPDYAPPKPTPHTPQSMLHWMRTRVQHFGSPLPDGFVPPPGIDLDALLKQIPWPPQDTH